MRLIDFAPSPFFRWHILLGKQTTVAAKNSRISDKQKAIYVCDGLAPDDFQINRALEQLNYKYGDWEWHELRRRKEWRWPWQANQRITKLGAGGTVFLRGGTYDIGTGVELPSMLPPIEQQIKEDGG